MRPQARKCRFCQAELTPQMIVGNTAICRACGLSDEISKGLNVWLKASLIVVGIFVTLGASIYFKNNIRIWLSPQSAIEKFTVEQAEKLKQECLKQGNGDCLIAVYKRLTELDGENDIYAANYAFQLTRARRFADADSIYQKLLARGVGTYDLMAFYAMNLDGLGQTDAAIKWYEKTLELEPNLVDITKNLAECYVKRQRGYEAVSLLRSFILKFPESEASLAGDLSADLELVSKSELKPDEQMRLVGLGRGQISLPLSIGSRSKAKAFLVDTGATLVTMPTKDAEESFPNLMSSASQTSARLADGREVTLHELRVPEIKVGNWLFNNIEVAYCDNCSRLAGMSLLKNLKMSVASKGNFFTIDISRPSDISQIKEHKSKEH